LNVSGDLTWSGGTMNGAGSTTVAGLASTISGTIGKVLNRTLTNTGTLAITTTDVSANFIFGTAGGQPGHLVNTVSGTVNVTAGGDFIASTDPNSSIDNAGAWNIAGPVATSSMIGSTIAFNNSGALNAVSGALSLDGNFLQTNGTTRLSGGAITTSSQLFFNGGDLSGAGTITGKVVNNGATVLPGDTAAGVLIIAGDYTQGASGTLNVDIGGTAPGTQHDQLAVSGAVALGGKLAVNLVNGYSPSSSDVLKIVVAGTRTGTFSSVTAPGMLTANYTPTEVRLAIGTTPSISINDASILEGRAGTEDLRFTVTLSSPSTQTVTVQFATADGTAIAPGDYTARTLTTLTFLPGEVSKFIDVAVVGDVVGESDETFFVNLSNPANATLADSQGEGTILDDEGGPTLSINNVAIAEGNSGTATAIFTVTLSIPSNLPVTVQYATINGTAMGGEDFTALPLSTLTFAPGETSQPVVVTISGESAVEPTEYFAVALSNPTNAAIATGVGAGAILNDDFKLSPGKLSFPEPDGDIVTVILKGASIGSANVTIGEDGSIEIIDLTQFARVQQAGNTKPLGLTIAVKTPNGGSGDGFTKVGLIKANGLGLGKVNVEGDLGQIMAGDGSGKAALKSLKISRDFGLAGGASRVSELLGAFGKLSVGGSVQKSSLQASGKVGKISIAEDLIGQPGLGAAALAAIAEVGVDGFLAGDNPIPAGMLLADSIGSLRIGGSVKMGSIATTKDLGAFSVLGDFLGGGIFSEGQMKFVKVIGKLTGDDPDEPVSVTARGKLTSLSIGGDVENGSILVGYNKNEEAVNPDAQIGKVLVKGNWIASSLVAGVQDITATASAATTRSLPAIRRLQSCPRSPR
jgi:hypothetical protein